MTSLRQALIDFPGARAPLPSQSANDRRHPPDRRGTERRNNVYPFESRDTRLHFAAQAAGFGVYDLDCTTGDSVWSPELRLMAGLPPEQGPLTTEQAEALIHPEDRERLADHLRASLEPTGDGEFEDEYRLLRADRSYRWVKTKGRTFFVGEGDARRPLAATGIVMDITASRLADQKLAESQEELDKMVEAAIDAVIILDQDQRIVRFNPSACRMFGCTAEEVMGSHVERFMPERYRADHPEKVRQFAESETPAQSLDSPRRFTGLRANGEEFPFEATVTKVKVDGHTRLTTFMRDITERIETEERLRHSVEDFELALRGGDIGIWNWNLRTGEVELSERCRQLFGIPFDEPVSYDRVMASVHPEDRAKVETALRRAAERGEEYKVEKRFIWPDGSVHWLEGIAREIYDQTGCKRVGLRGIILDITQRKEAEEALKHSKEQLELAVRASNIGIWHWDISSNAVEWSDRNYQLFGLPPGEVLSHEKIMSMILPEDRKRVEEALEGAVASNKEFIIENRVVWTDGSVHWLKSIGRSQQDGRDGTAGGIRGITLEITERKRREEELLHHREELEARVEERTRELSRANAALEQSNLELQQFAFIAAHDMQTPLRSISGFAQLIQREYSGRLDPQAGVWLNQMVRSVHRMRDVIYDILDYSRVESRGHAFRPTDLNSLLEEVVSTLDAPIRETGAVITHDELPTMMGDRSQLAQVLQNLIDNAMKYCEDKVPRIHVSARREESGWTISVRDKGIGIPEKHLDSIFDVFRRLHSQQDYPGTGIGLAICRRVIHRHGGRIWAESEPGKGSTFYFTLPDGQGDA